jgi:hypothetical protein
MVIFGGKGYFGVTLAAPWTRYQEKGLDGKS